MRKKVFAPENGGGGGAGTPLPPPPFLYGPVRAWLFCKSCSSLFRSSYKKTRQLLQHLWSKYVRKIKPSCGLCLNIPVVWYKPETYTSGAPWPIWQLVRSSSWSNYSSAFHRSETEFWRCHEIWEAMSLLTFTSQGNSLVWVSTLHPINNYRNSYDMVKFARNFWSLYLKRRFKCVIYAYAEIFIGDHSGATKWVPKGMWYMHCCPKDTRGCPKGVAQRMMMCALLPKAFEVKERS